MSSALRLSNKFIAQDLSPNFRKQMRTRLLLPQMVLSEILNCKYISWAQYISASLSKSLAATSSSRDLFGQVLIVLMLWMGCTDFETN